MSMPDIGGLAPISVLALSTKLERGDAAPPVWTASPSRVGGGVNIEPAQAA